VPSWVRAKREQGKAERAVRLWCKSDPSNFVIRKPSLIFLRMKVIWKRFSWQAPDLWVRSSWIFLLQSDYNCRSDLCLTTKDLLLSPVRNSEKQLTSVTSNHIVLGGGYIAENNWCTESGEDRWIFLLPLLWGDIFRVHFLLRVLHFWDFWLALSQLNAFSSY
jgi:hypothetical protein